MEILQLYYITELAFSKQKQSVNILIIVNPFLLLWITSSLHKDKELLSTER